MTETATTTETAKPSTKTVTVASLDCINFCRTSKTRARSSPEPPKPSKKRENRYEGYPPSNSTPLFQHPDLCRIGFVGQGLSQVVSLFTLTLPTHNLPEILSTCEFWEPNGVVTQGGISVTVQSPPFWSAFCGITFRPLLVWQAILVAIQSEFPALAKGSPAIAKKKSWSWTIAKSLLFEPPQWGLLNNCPLKQTENSNT